MIRAILLLFVALVFAACGTVATPIPQQSEEAAEVGEETEAEVVAVEPTATEEPPTDVPTEIPPTEAPTEVPATATPEPTEAVAADPIVAQVAIGGDAAAGEELFNQMISEVGFACSTCHVVADDTVLVGPSLLGIASNAGERVEGEVAERYLHTSIVNPNDYVVEGFNENLMPRTYTEVLSDADILNLVAYLMTIEG